jgi:hypothetical protein
LPFVVSDPEGAGATMIGGEEMTGGLDVGNEPPPSGSDRRV